jgi:hypothetical protein
LKNFTFLRSQFTISIMEFCKANRLVQVLGDIEPDHHDYANLNKMKDAMNEQTNEVTVLHSTNKETIRKFNKYGYQNMTKQLRDYFTHDTHTDFDLQNCHPTIFRQVLLRYLPNGAYDQISNYVLNRDQVINDILNAYPDLTRFDVKQAFCCALNMGNPNKYTTHPIQQIHHFRAQVRAAAIHLQDHYPKLFKLAEAKAELDGNLIGKFVAYICQTHEQQIIQVASSVIKSRNHIIDTNMHDGLLVRGVLSKQEIQDTCAMVEKMVREKLEFDVVFTSKLIDNPGPINQLDIMHNIDANDRLVFLDFDDLAHKKNLHWNFRPMLDRISRFADNGIKFGLYSSEHDILPVDRVQAITGLTFDIVLTKKHCFESSVKYRNKHPLARTFLKPLSRYFPDNEHVYLISSSLFNTSTRDHHRVLRISERFMETYDDYSVLNAVNASITFDGRSDNRYIYGPNVETIHEDEMIEYTNEHTGKKGKCVKPIQFAPGQRVYLLRGDMNNGKTVAERNLIRDQLNRNPHLKVLILSCRIAHGFTIFGDVLEFDFAFYQQIKDSKELRQKPRLVIQYESLCRLGDDIYNYDLIVLDECRSIANQMLSKTTNGRSYQKNMSLFESVMRTAPQILMMDAHMEIDNTMKVFIDQYFSPEEWKMVRYTRVGMQRSFKHVGNDPSQSVEEMKKLLADKKKYGALYRQKNQLLQTNKAIGHPSHKCLDLYSEMPSEKNAMIFFQNINEAANMFDRISYTSKVTVGTSIQVPFEKVFIMAQGKGRGCKSRDMEQMYGRFRNLVNTEIDVVCGEIDTSFTWTNREEAYERHLAFMKHNHKIREDYVTNLHGKGLVKKGEVQWSSTFNERLVAASMAESEQPFSTYFWYITSKYSGHTWTVVNPTETKTNHEVKQDIKKCKEELDEQAVKIAHEYGKTIGEMTEDQIKREMELIEHVKNHAFLNMIEDQLNFQTFFHATRIIKHENILKLQPYELLDLTNDEVKSKLYILYHIINKKYKPLSEVIDVNKLEKTKDANSIKLWAGATSRLDNCLKKIGFVDGLADRTSQVPLQSVDCSYVTKECDTVEALRGGKSIKSKKKRDVTKVLNRELAHCALMVQSVQGPKSEGRKRKLHIVEDSVRLGKRYKVSDDLISDEDEKKRLKGKKEKYTCCKRLVSLMKPPKDYVTDEI